MKMKNAYTKPDIQLVVISPVDLLNGSDVLIDGSELFENE